MPHLSFPPPTDHQEFERLIAEIARTHWWASLVSANGRAGQAQNGVDVNVTTTDQRFIGIQCKLTTKTLSIGTVEKEIGQARNYKPELNEFIVATTAKSDAGLLEAVRLLPAQKFKVAIWSWNEINNFLNRLAPLGLDYARRVILGSVEDIEREHAAYIREALDRPAFLHSAHAERNFHDQRQAIKDTSKFLRTGYLYTRDGHLVSQLPYSRYSETYSAELAAVLRAVDSLDRHLPRTISALLDSQHKDHAAARATVEVKRLRVLDEANKMLGRMELELLPKTI